MNKPRLLDLFSGAGGCAKGYYDAGFDIVGVDIAPQPRYPYTFIQANALDVLNKGVWQGYALDDFSIIHASPPCQHATSMLNNNKRAKRAHTNLIPATRKLLELTGLPYIIENVVGASTLNHGITLCGLMFDLRVYRHRRFESNILLFAPEHIKHQVKAAKSGKIPGPDEFWSPIGNFGQKDAAQRAMGIDWMKITGSKDREIAQAIPPAYTHWIGMQLMDIVQSEVAS